MSRISIALSWFKNFFNIIFRSYFYKYLLILNFFYC
ncbi:hypothetical protein CoNPh17_CDS0074 [Staphylococcus phage S-CoN_Ph17]|nr:hypothetical protein CoNPh17_CDS0074 [Staphylococcus phage S-CoN_Ph17]